MAFKNLYIILSNMVNNIKNTTVLMTAPVFLPMQQNSCIMQGRH